MTTNSLDIFKDKKINNKMIGSELFSNCWHRFRSISHPVQLLSLPLEWQSSTPPTTLHSCAGLHCQGSQVMLWLPLHLQRSEQSISVNQASPTYTQKRSMHVQTLFLAKVPGKYPPSEIHWAHLPACTFHLHQYIHTRWVGHICLRWGRGRGYRSIPLHRAGCKSHRGP